MCTPRTRKSHETWHPIPQRLRDQHIVNNISPRVIHSDMSTCSKIHVTLTWAQLHIRLPRVQICSLEMLETHFRAFPTNTEKVRTEHAAGRHASSFLTSRRETSSRRPCASAPPPARRLRRILNLSPQPETASRRCRASREP